jgi:hypothetical protein
MERKDTIRMLLLSIEELERGKISGHQHFTNVISYILNTFNKESQDTNKIVAIQYITRNGGRCLTSCEVMEHVNVGSAGCINCSRYIAHIDPQNILICRCPGAT